MPKMGRTVHPRSVGVGPVHFRSWFSRAVEEDMRTAPMSRLVCRSGAPVSSACETHGSEYDSLHSRLCSAQSVRTSRCGARSIRRAFAWSEIHDWGRCDLAVIWQCAAERTTRVCSRDSVHDVRLAHAPAKSALSWNARKSEHLTLLLGRRRGASIVASDAAPPASRHHTATAPAERKIELAWCLWSSFCRSNVCWGTLLL